jgi:hypothetical protein
MGDWNGNNKLVESNLIRTCNNPKKLKNLKYIII